MPNIINNFPLSNITTLKIGGPAKQFLVVKTKEELTNAIKEARQSNQEFLVIGGGSNLLIADEGINKLIIKNEASGIELKDPNTVIVQSGTPLQDLVDFTIKNGFFGTQKLTAIPGTVGGAIYG